MFYEKSNSITLVFPNDFGYPVPYIAILMCPFIILGESGNSYVVKVSGTSYLTVSKTEFQSKVDDMLDYGIEVIWQEEPL